MTSLIYYDLDRIWFWIEFATYYDATKFCFNWPSSNGNKEREWNLSPLSLYPVDFSDPIPFRVKVIRGVFLKLGRNSAKCDIPCQPLIPDLKAIFLYLIWFDLQQPRSVMQRPEWKIPTLAKWLRSPFVCVIREWSLSIKQREGGGRFCVGASK